MVVTGEGSALITRYIKTSQVLSDLLEPAPVGRSQELMVFSINYL